MAETYYNQIDDSPFINNCPPSQGHLELSSSSTSLSSSLTSIPSSIDQQIPQMHLIDTNRKYSSAPLRYFGSNSYNMNIKTAVNSNGKYNHNFSANPNINYANNYHFGNNNHTTSNYYMAHSNNSVYRNRYAPYHTRPNPMSVQMNCNSSNDNLSLGSLAHHHNYSMLPQHQEQLLPTEFASSSIQYYNGYQNLYNNNNHNNMNNNNINNNNSSNNNNNTNNNNIINNTTYDSGSREPNCIHTIENNLILDGNPLCSNNNIQTIGSATSSSSSSSTSSSSFNIDLNNHQRSSVILQISNLDYTVDEANLRSFLLSQLKPITQVISLIFEGSSSARVEVPDIYYAKQVVANLHRKKIGHKRMVVSYTRDSSLTEIHTLRCQVAGLLKDVPYCTLPMYKFRELFQSRFKTSISVLDLYKMQDICSITIDKNDEKYITLNPDIINSIENSSLMESLQESVPYCTLHFKKEQHKGWAEEDISPLPNVFMTISEIKNITYMLLKIHKGDIPVLSLVHCISGELNVEIKSNDNGVNLEHLICCVNGIQITSNSFGVKILSWLAPENAIAKEMENRLLHLKSGINGDPLYQISREVVELLKMSPKATMKFNRFIPAYHNHFGKQCRVADYGYTKLIELFEALSSVVQIMGDGENRQITLTHRTQIRRFTTDLLRILRSQASKSILLSQLPEIFSQTQNRQFDVTDYGICSIVDILDGLVNSNIVVITHIQNGKDILISIPKRKQTNNEIEKTCVFAGEVVELFRNASQYSILFQKFVRSYHYHFGYQCRLSDYGFLKLADLMEAIQGIVEVEAEVNNDEDKKIFLTSNIARRVFSEQLEDLIKNLTGSGKKCIKLDEVLKLHKKQYGYQMKGQTLGFVNLTDAIRNLPYVEIVEMEDEMLWISCHNKDQSFRNKCYRAYRVFAEFSKDYVPINDFIAAFNLKYHEIFTEQKIAAMKHLFKIKKEQDFLFVGITRLMNFIVTIVKLLEKKIMNIAEIKAILNIGVTDCFEFGYPNLYTLLNAYSDIFSCEIGPIERSEISLVIPNELLSDTNNESKQNDQHINKNSSHKYNNYISRQPLAILNKIQGPAKINRTNNSNSNNIDNYFNMPQQQNNSYYKNSTQYPQQKLTSTSASANNPFQPIKNYPLTNFNYKSLDNGIQYKMNKSLNSFDQNEKENSFKNCTNLNGTMNSSLLSLELNNSQDLNQNINNYSGFGITNTSGNSFDNLNVSNISQINNNYNSIIYNGNETKINDNDKIPKLWNSFDYFKATDNGNNKNKIIVDETNDNILSIDDIVFKSSDIPSVFSIPPKPDTPPTMSLPFWIDPIWANNNDVNNNVNLNNNNEITPSSKPDSANIELNIKLPELKTFNILPTLMSPYSVITKTDNSNGDIFSFDSPDKKI